MMRVDELFDPDATVIAWRNVNHHGLFMIERPDRVRILEPGDRGWGQ